MFSTLEGLGLNFSTRKQSHNSKAGKQMANLRQAAVAISRCILLVPSLLLKSFKPNACTLVTESQPRWTGQDMALDNRWLIAREIATSV